MPPWRKSCRPRRPDSPTSASPTSRRSSRRRSASSCARSLEALVIVLAVSFLSLGWRTGIVVGLSVPLVLAIVFIVMQLTGLNLHRITLGALIIALGLMVDDAIIAVEMMQVKMEQGVNRAEAAGLAWTSTAFPRLTGALVTAAGFMPVGLSVSSTGEYAGAIFSVVGLALLASWLVAGMFTPYLGLKLLPDVKVHHDADPNAIYDTPMYRTPARGRRAGACSTACGSSGATAGAFAARPRRLHLRAAAILSDLRAERAVRPVPHARRQHPSRDSGGREEGRTAPCRRRRRRNLHDLHRPGTAAVLARAQSGAAERSLCRDGHRREGRKGARTAEGEGRCGGCQGQPSPKRGCERIASPSGRRSAFRSSSVSSAAIRRRSAPLPTRCAT